MSGKPTDDVQEDSVEEVLEELEQVVPEGAEVEIVVEEPDVLPEMVSKREYRLELFEEGDNNVFARQPGLAREGWKWPVIHGFRRRAPSGLVADSFLILVASREVEAPAGEVG